MSSMGECSTVSTNNKKQKNGPKSGLVGHHGPSPVWDHFTKYLIKETQKYSGKAECKYCQLVVDAPSGGGTNKLWNHLKSGKCKKFPGFVKDTNTQSVLSINDGQATIWFFDQEKCRASLARMTVLDELPFSHVEKEGFRQFCHAMQPKFHVISRTTLTKDCIKLFYVEKCKLKDYLKEFSKRVSLTTDMWTSVQNLGYMVITAHFVDKDWILRKKIISFKVVPHPHKGEVLAKAVETSLVEWGLENVMTITLDNAKNNDTCVSDLVRRLNRRNALLLEGEFIQVRCFAHVINLVVRNGVDEAKPTIKRLRRSVKYVRSSPSRLQAFKKSVSEENLTSKRAVCLDVKTRWNSTYLMIDSALEFKEAFENLELNDPSYKHECTVKGELLDEGDWGILKALHTFLEEFYLLTKRVSGSKYCTSNMYFDELIQVKDLILHNLGSGDLFLREMAEKMNEKLNKYCKIDSLNLILVVALVLDPRYKLQYVEYWYSTFLEKTTDHNEEVRSEQVEGFVKKLKDLMKKLFNHYKAENLSMYNVDDPQNEANTTNSVGMVVKRPSSKELFKGTLKRKSHGEMLSDLDMYLSDEVLEADEHHFDILAWWKEKVPAYHALAIMARDILAIPVTSVASECAFSTAGRVLDSFRSSLTPMIVECLITTQDWLRSPMPIISVEERLETLEEIEEAVLAEMNALDIASTS